MKKILLIISVTFFAVTLYAQTFHILDAGKNNVSNGTAIATGDANTVIKGQMYIVNATGAAAQFKVKKIEINVLNGTMNTFCFNDQCYPPNIFQSTSSLTVQPGDTTPSSGFYGEYTAGGITGNSIIIYVVTNAADANDSTYVTYTYDGQPASINKPEFSRIEFSNPYPNPVVTSTRINYNIPFAYKRAVLVIRNIIGTSVKEIELTNAQGKISIDMTDLNEGIYFYSLIIDGHVGFTRKLIKN